MVVELSGDDVLLQLLDHFSVSVETLHSPRKTSTSREVQVLQGWTVLQQKRQGFHAHRSTTKVEFSAKVK
jgi:hypothetical protein